MCVHVCVRVCLMCVHVCMCMWLWVGGEGGNVYV